MPAISWESFSRESRVKSREPDIRRRPVGLVTPDSQLATSMHIFVYEWATGGGLVEEPGPLPASLVREGAAMIGALAGDLQRIAGCRISAFRDPRVVQLALGGCKVVDVLSRFDHDEEFARLSGEADATILIAPELDGILLKSSRRVVG